MRIERTRNTFKNGSWGLLNKFVLLIFPFITRTCIIYILGVKYTGLSNLFTSILSILSLAELGFGNAIIYSMYKPIADNDEKKICALMNFYRKVYLIIGLVVLGIGLLLIPFIPCFIKDDIPNDVNIYILYSFYLSESVLSYWLFAYKNCLLVAFQKNYVSLNVSTVVNFLMSVVQIVFLFYTENYYWFIIWKPLSIIIINIVTAHFVSKKYPQYTCKGFLDGSEKKRIKKQVVGLMMQRLAFSSRNSFDSIVISSYLGLVIVGIYNNYFYLLTALTLVLSLVFSSMQGGIGNSIAMETKEKNYVDFRKINFVYMSIAGECAFCLAVLIQPFMNLWVGEKLMFPNYFAFVFAFYFYTIKMTDAEGAYIAGTGIWWRCKGVYLVEAITNLILNIVLGHIWGVIGVMMASLISVIFVNFLANGVMLFKYYFGNKKFWTIVVDNLYVLVVSSITTAIIWNIIKRFPENETKKGLIILLIEKSCVSFVLGTLIMVALLSFNKQFKVSCKWLLKKIKRKGS